MVFKIRYLFDGTTGATVRPGAFYHLHNTSKMPQRKVTGEELTKVMRKFKYVFVKIDYTQYYRTQVPVDKKEFRRHMEGSGQHDYVYIIDDNYEFTLYIEQVIRTEKQPAGETVDTPGDNLAS